MSCQLANTITLSKTLNLLSTLTSIETRHLDSGHQSSEIDQVFHNVNHPTNIVYCYIRPRVPLGDQYISDPKSSHRNKHTYTRKIKIGL